MIFFIAKKNNGSILFVDTYSSFMKLVLNGTSYIKKTYEVKCHTMTFLLGNTNKRFI